MKSDGVELCIGWYRTVGCIVAISSSGILAKQPSKQPENEGKNGKAEDGERVTFSAVARVPDLRTGAAASQVGTRRRVYVLGRGRCALAPGCMPARRNA